MSEVHLPGLAQPLPEKALMLDSIHPNASLAFGGQGFEVVEFSRTASPQELSELIAGVSVLGLRSSPPIPREVIEAADRLEAIGVYSVGTNHVDLEAASERGIAVFNAPHENTRSVAEMVIGLTYSLFRQIQSHNLSMSRGTWSKTAEGSYELRGKTMGVVGYGSVGSQVVELALKNDMDAVWFDPSPRMGYEQGRSRRTLSIEELLEQADVISLHVPGGQKILTRELIFGQMKPGSYVINTSRGEAVDTEALADAIEAGHIAGAAIDVFENEPGKKGDVFNHLLREHPQVILTPHQAGSTAEAEEQAGKNTTNKLLDYIMLGRTAGSVNLPELGAPEMNVGDTRIMNIHRNVPGALTAITSKVSEHGINIEREYLETRRALGYLILDTEGEVPTEALDAIRSLDVTIKQRSITYA